jgi:hypothetical protein
MYFGHCDSQMLGAHRLASSIAVASTNAKITTVNAVRPTPTTSAQHSRRLVTGRIKTLAIFSRLQLYQLSARAA